MLEREKATQEELNKILDKHEKWQDNEKGGKRADLSYKDLSGLDFVNWHFQSADLRYANLRYANLQDADLQKAYLQWATISGCKGLTVIAVQVHTSRKNNLLSYYKELEIVTTGCFQGTLEELKEEVAETHKDNDFLRHRYERAIAYIENEVKEEEKCSNLK